MTEYGDLHQVPGKLGLTWIEKAATGLCAMPQPHKQENPLLTVIKYLWPHLQIKSGRNQSVIPLFIMFWVRLNERPQNYMIP